MIIKPKHECPDWDFLEIEEGDPEMQCCSCEFEEDENSH